MSESEKKKRGLYRKNREKWIFAQAVIVAVVTIAVLISALVSYQLNMQYYIEYNESGSIDYDVYLKDNEFYDSPHQEKNQSYVASLIDKIITNFNYEIDMDAEDVNYRYSYTITSRLEILDNTSNIPIYNPEYTLIDVRNKLQNTSKRLTINEIVILNYDQYNELASRFLQTYDLNDTTSNIVVTLNVDVLSDCNAFSGSSVDTYSSELRIPLTTKTVNVKMTSSVPAAESKMIACSRGAGSEVFKTTAIVLGVVDALLISLLTAFIYLTRTADITYTARVKKILSQYKSYIQKIKNLFETQGYQVVLVDSFDELLEIKDTIQAPILMYENEDKTCTKFMIPTDSKLLYLFEIKVDGYVEPQPEPKEEPSPTTVVKPNITNVVRPIVKVVVNSPTPPSPTDPTPDNDSEPEIETVFEDAEVEIDAEEGAEPVVVATVEDGNEYDNVELTNADDSRQAVATIANAEEEAEFDEVEDNEFTTIIDGKAITFRYKKSFLTRLIQSDDRIKSYYSTIKNKLLSYKGIKARTSWSFESCNKGRIQCAKLNVRGKALLVYLNLNTAKYTDSKYRFQYTGDKIKYADVPMLLKVKGDRSLKHALELIEDMMNDLGIPMGEAQNIDYTIPYQTTDELIEAGLIKLISRTEDNVVNSDDPEIAALLDSIPMVDEDTAEAIDVFKDKKKIKILRYDPDGNSLEAGDIVLVSTRDKAGDKEVVREAEVARGNYKIEAASLDRPLTKIIGVVRRKAEQIFTAMITPIEDKEN